MISVYFKNQWKYCKAIKWMICIFHHSHNHPTNSGHKALWYNMAIWWYIYIQYLDLQVIWMWPSLSNITWERTLILWKVYAWGRFQYYASYVTHGVLGSLNLRPKLHSRGAYSRAQNYCTLFNNPNSHRTVKHRQLCCLKRVIKLISHMLF